MQFPTPRIQTPRSLGRPLVALGLGLGLTLPATAQVDAQAAPGELAIRGVQRPSADRATFVPGQVILKPRADLGAADRSALEAELGLLRLATNERLDATLYELPVGLSVADALRRLRGDARLEYVEPNGLSYLHQVPNDGFYDNYGGVATDLQKWVYDGLGGDRNVNAEAAWDLTTGRSDVVIAVIDTGVHLSHPDLAPNIWTNPGEIAGNGQDDDGNGFVDDVNGWDFRNNDSNPNPDYGDGLDNDFNGAADDGTFHGTFAASCAAARGNDGSGMAGAAWGCKIMAIKIFTDDGGASTFDIAGGITYAADNGADVTNMSFGGGYSSTVQNAVNYSWSRGVVQVGSAGNSNSSSAQYPSSLPHVISVGASDSGSVYAGGSGDIDGRASFSQYGTNAVDVVAPGHQLVGASVGTVAGGNAGQSFWQLSSGTSFSGPMVAGLCGLVISRARDLGTALSNDDVEAIVQDTAVDLPDDPNDSPNGGSNWDGNGRVDFAAAVGAVSGGGGGPVNNPPVADAGANQAGLVGDAFSFDGGGSFDPDGDAITSYQWNFGDGTTGSGASVQKSYSASGSYTVTLTVSDGELTDADSLNVTVSDPPPTGGDVEVWLASSNNNSVAGVGTVANEDIVRYDPGTGNFTLMFDGSDVGIGSTAIDALHVFDDGDLLISLTAAFSVPGLTGGPSGNSVDDSDLILFTPSSLGSNTSGVWTFFMDGSDIGLTGNGEDIDGVSLAANQDLLISTNGSASVTGQSGIRDEDVFRFVWATLGSSTSGSSVLEFDGSDVGLSSSSSEDVNALHSGDGLYFSTIGTFGVAGVAGDDEDVTRFSGNFGASTSGSFELFIDGSALGLPGNWDVQGLCVR